MDEWKYLNRHVKERGKEWMNGKELLEKERKKELKVECIKKREVKQDGL